MESVIQKLFPAKRKRSSKQFGFFCRRSRQTPAVIELPTKDAEKEQQEAAVVVSMPPPDVRLILFRECGETSDRKLLFDSKSFEPEKAESPDEIRYFSMSSSQQASLNNNTKCHPIRPSSCYQYVRGPQDIEILSEMLFGTVGMASRASSLKIHIRKEQDQVMLSRVFCVESTKETVSLDRGMDYHLRPTISVLSRRKAKTLPVPTPEPPHIPPPAPISIASILGASLSATGSLGSRSTPLQIPSNLRAHSLPPATRQASRDSFTLTQEPQGVTSRKTKVKIGFAVIFQPEPTNSSEFQRFFFEHFPLIESYVTFLKEQVESALNNNRRRNHEFVQAMMEALHVFTLRVTAIYSSPRLPKPVWSTLTTMSSSKFPWMGDPITVEIFIADLTRMVTQHNTKNKNFFMTGLITSVLTHHLGWVNSAVPPSGENESPLLTYNPLWAQLGDLYGAVGTPTKVAKTVIVGEIHELVSTIISILSYFIRCSTIEEVVAVPEDITPQTFLDDDNGDLTMSLIPSDLGSDYVFVAHKDQEEQSSMTESVTNEIATITSKPFKPVKQNKFSFSRKTKISEPIRCDLPTPDSGLPNGGSPLCRSRSSPGTMAKPPLRVNRQKSIGYAENLPSMRHRTNSNDAFARPRGVQSRRTSYDVTNVRRMSQSSSALVIPDSEKSDMGTVSSLEGSKSLCMGPTPTSDTDLLRKRLGKENLGSYSNKCLVTDDFADEIKPLTTNVNRKKFGVTASFAGSKAPLVGKKIALSESKTHKRVSSEPFRIDDLPNIHPDKSLSLLKTNSIYFDSKNAPFVKPTFVGNIEPKVVHVTHVQRSQPVLAMPSPASSPHLPRSKSTVGQKGPILGFKTSETDGSHRLRSNYSSVSCVNSDKSLVKRETSSNSDLKDVFSPDKTTKTTTTGHQNKNFDFTSPEPRVQRSSSNLSTGGVVRRNSSSNSGKIKLAGRRRKLTGDSTKNESFEEKDDSEESKILPPLIRIPSVSLEHDQFEEYFEESEEYIYFKTENQPDDTHCSSDTQNRSTDSSQCDRSSVAKSAPPPLPSIAPCHRSQSLKSENIALKSLAKPQSQPNITPKVPPPLPVTPPVHRGRLYPTLDEASLSQPTLYPSLKNCNDLTHTNICKPPTQTPNRIHPSFGLTASPQIDPPPPKLYPRLPAAGESCAPCVTALNGSEREEHHFHDSTSKKDFAKEEEETGSSDEDINCFDGREKIPLAPITFTEDPRIKADCQESDKPSRLTFAELMADYSPDYLWGFPLHGTRNQCGLYSNIIHELQHSVSKPVLDEPVAEAVSIVADTDKWTVKVLSSHRIHSDKTALPAMTSKLVTNILERITRLYQIKTPAAFCLQQLENELGELVLKSRMLAGYVVGNTRVTMSQLSAVLGIESSDLPLLMAIASCHSPQVAAKLL